MKRSWFPIFLVSALLTLLGVLAVFQYLWLGQVSEGERERTRRRLEIDSRRFAEDFNREIQNAYFNFQTIADPWKTQKWQNFNERRDFWRQKTAYPNLIRDFYFWQTADGGAALLRYDAERGAFVGAAWTDELKNLKAKAEDEKTYSPVAEEFSALVMPVYEKVENVERVLIRKDSLPPEMEKPQRYGYLIILLDEEVLKKQILSDLSYKYFPEGDFNLSVTGSQEQKIFQTQTVNGADVSVKLFSLAPDNFIFFANRDLMPKIRTAGKTGVMTYQQKFETKSISNVKTESFERKLPAKESKTFTLEINQSDKPRTAIIETGNFNEEGYWTLDVQHAAGSLDQFIANARRKNLGISFGILGLLGVSIVLIFVSAQRAKLLAQRQIDFVSSVSHEFRTPLAVIYSAGENLADGVAKEGAQVSRYGNLIKGEGRKLSAMVEQILEFAGARSGRKKYDLRPADVREIIEDALAECRPLIDEKGFAVESEIAEKLPPVKADSNALSQAIQNLIVNSLKYSNGEKWLKISASNGGGKIKITVEDKGIGIAKHDLKHIFEPFFRAKAVVDEQIHGNGLGLSLVKDTIEAHGGRITADSEVGKGSRFTIHLPWII